LLDQIERTPGHIVEIGTHLGHTAKEIATAFPTRSLFCVDCCAPEYGLKLEDIGSATKGMNNVALTIMDSKLYAIPSGTGVIFIDGDHTWEGVKADTENALRHYKTHQGLIVWHDYNQEFEVMPYLEWIRFRNCLNIYHVQNSSLAFLVL
jgi:hypothetical protein